jgi:putative endonuclease
MAPDLRRRTGRLGERLAAERLVRSGYRVIDRNYRKREGELDLVAARGGVLVFCEVKTLIAPDGFQLLPASPLESVGPRKRAKIRRLARAWLADRAAARSLPRFRDMRFDAIGVVLSASGELVAFEHIESAF